MFENNLLLNVAGFQQPDFDNYIKDIKTITIHCNNGVKLDSKLTTHLFKIIEQTSNINKFCNSHSRGCLLPEVERKLRECFARIASPPSPVNP